MSDFLEKLFLPGMKDGLCALFRVNTIHEIYEQKSVILPTELQRVAQEEILATRHDLRERDVSFGFQSGKIIPLNKSIGTKIDLKTLTARSTGESLFESSNTVAKVYFGKPLLVAFHTHPRFIVQQLREKNLTTLNLTHKKSKQSVDLPIDKGTELLNALTEYPSSDDIDHLLRNNRYWRSMLLGGDWGYKFIVNPKLSIQIVDIPKAIKQFKNSWGETFFEAAKIMQTDSRRGIQMWHEGIQSALMSYCNINGLLLFTNTNPQSNILNRIV